MYSTDYYGEQWRADRSGVVTLFLLEALGFRSTFAGTKQVSKLTMHFAHNGSFERVMVGATPLSSSTPTEIIARLSTILEGFRYLTDIDLKVPFAADPPQMHALRCGAEIASFLSMAKNLQRLRLAYSDDETGIFVPRLPEWHSLDRLFIHHHLWPQIQHLSLSTDIRSEVLLPFLSRFSPTLRSLELRDMVVFDVPAVIMQIPKILSLDHVYIECIWHEVLPNLPANEESNYLCAFPRGTDTNEPDEEAVKRYMLGLTTETPAIVITAVPEEDEDDNDDDDDDDDE